MPQRGALPVEDAATRCPACPVECEAYSSGVAPRGKTGTWPADGTGALGMKWVMGICQE